MALDDSLKKVRETRDKLRSEMEETRKQMQELRPKPLRHMVDKRMTNIRPLKRIRKRLTNIEETTETPAVGANST